MPKKRQKKRKKRPPQVEHKPFWAERGKSIKRYIKEGGYLDDEPVKNPWEDDDDRPDYVMRHYAQQIMPQNDYLCLPPRMTRRRLDYPSSRETNLCNEISLGEFCHTVLQSNLRGRFDQEAINIVADRMQRDICDWEIRIYESYFNQTKVPHACITCSAYTGSPYLRCAIHPDLKENCESWEPKK